MIKQEFINNPSGFIYSSSLLNKNYTENDNEIIIEENNQLLLYYPKGYNYKFNINKGYERIYLTDELYNKKIRNNKFDYLYKDRQFCKAVYFKNNNGEKFIEVNLLYNDITYLDKKLNEDVNLVIVECESDEKLITLLKEKGFSNFVLWHELTLKPREIVNNEYEFNCKLKEIEVTNKKPKLLIHSCCGPCSTYCLELLNKYFEITILYYNPNIVPFNEYKKRLDEQIRLIKENKMGINVLTFDYSHDEFLDSIKGINDESEGGIRCFSCYEFRLRKTALFAKENNYDYFSTTLSISPYKNSKKINEIGIRLQEELGIKFLYSNFKLNDGYKKSIELSKKYELYRQDYCGCEYSQKFHNKK